MSLAALLDEPMAGRDDAVRKQTREVLLLGNDDRVLLSVARGLGRNGITVHVAWCDPNSAALQSRYVSQFHEVTAYAPDSNAWLRSLHSVVGQHEFDLVIPCNDFAVVPLQNSRDQLDSHTPWYLLNDKAFRIAFDKGKTSQLAAELNINLPRECTLTADEMRRSLPLKEILATDTHPLRFPVYVKPRSSITHCDVAHKRVAVRVETPEALAQYLGQASAADGVLIQEHFSGVGIGVEVLANQGKVLMQIQHRRLRETIDGGSTYRETIAEIPELTDATAKMVARLKYTGVGMFEYRYDLKTGEWVFLEINGRFWGSIALAVAAGANFPFALYQLLVEGRTDFDRSYRVGTRCRNLIKDLRAYRQQPASRFELASLLLGKDHLDFFARDDWRPQAATIHDFVAGIAGKILRRRTRAQAGD